MQHEHDRPASFHSSPAEAMQAPPEEFLYLACLHEGTGVHAPDFLAVVDAEDGRIVHETPMPNVGDELASLRLEPLLVGLPRSRPLASHRARVPLVTDPHRGRRRQSAGAADREGDRVGGTCRQDRVHQAAHGALHAGRQRRRLDARRRRRQRRRWLRRPRCEDVRGQGPLGERRRDTVAQLRLLVPTAQERAPLVRVRRAERVRAGIRPRRRRGAGGTGTVSTSGIWPSASWSRPSTSARAGCFRSKCVGSTIPRRKRASSALRFRARCGAFGATTAAGPPTR